MLPWVRLLNIENSLGLEMHEHPYLNGANDEKLKIGEVVSNEPVSSTRILLGLRKSPCC